MALSKSQYLQGLQCHKALWLRLNSEMPVAEPGPEIQDRLQLGAEIGNLAKTRYPEGVEASGREWGIEQRVRQTMELIANGHHILFEATAQDRKGEVHARADILVRDPASGKWHLLEVKSSTSVKGVHLDDLAFQYWVFTSAGFDIATAGLLLIDSTYRKHGPLDPRLFFREDDVTEQVLDRVPDIPRHIEQMQLALAQDSQPEIQIGHQCFSPYACAFKEHCWARVPAYSVFDVFPKKKAEEIAQELGLHVQDLPDDLIPPKKTIDVKAHLEHQVHADKDGLSKFLSGLDYPLYFLDYETINPGIPIFDGTTPYQHIPFQFSLHVQGHSGGDVRHFEFLHKRRSDPRPDFIRALLANIGPHGSIIVYNQLFESTRNSELAQDFRDHEKQLLAINARMVDLMVPFSMRLLYHPQQNGSASIKKVLPCFTDSTYDGMLIASGGDASLRYKHFIQGKLDANEIPALWEGLSAYCYQDTMGMVLLLEALKSNSM